MGLFDKKSAEDWFDQGYELVCQQRYGEALEAYNKAIKIDPKYAEAWSSKGLALWALQRYWEALEACNKSIEIDPNNANPWNIKGGTLYDLQRYEEAIVACSKSIEIDPNDADVWNIKGCSLNMVRKNKEALEAHERGIEVDPNNEGLWFNKGNVLSDLQQYEAAVEAYDCAAGINPNNAKIWHNKAIALNKMQKYEEASEAFYEVVKNEPNDASAWNNLGSGLYDLQQYEEALNCCDRAIELEPTYDEPKELKEKIKDKIFENASIEKANLKNSVPQSIKKSPYIIERTIFDPVSTDFILSIKRDLPNVQQWIMSHDPSSYWYVICIKNLLDQPIDEWGISLEVGKTVGISDIIIENNEVHVAVDEYIDKEKPWVKAFHFGFSRYDGVVIPRDGSLRLYMKLYSKACNIDFTINGRFFAEGYESIDILEKRFNFACDVQNYTTALTTNPEKVKSLTETVLSRSFDPGTTRVLLHAFTQIREINQCCSQRKYHLLLDKMRVLDDLFKKVSAPKRVQKILNNSILAVEMMEDGEETYEQVEHMWSMVLDIWQNEYIIR